MANPVGPPRWFCSCLRTACLSLVADGIQSSTAQCEWPGRFLVSAESPDVNNPGNQNWHDERRENRSECHRNTGQRALRFCPRGASWPCAVVPTASPRATGLAIRKRDRNQDPSMEPSAPVAMTNAAVRASSPPSRLAISTAIGAATDFGASDMVITGSSRASRATAMPLTRLTREPVTMSTTTAGSCYGSNSYCHGDKRLSRRA